MNRAAAALAYRYGQTITRYNLWAMRPGRIVVEGWANLPDGPAIIAGWHGMNLMGMCVYRLLLQPRGRSAASFTPPGLVGAAARGWLERAGMEAIALPKDGSGNPTGALKRIARAMQAGKDVVIAVDGPAGPVYQVRPGALWLARLTGCPIVPAAVAARPGLHLPRWDQLLLALAPGARTVAVFEPPLTVEREARIDEALLAALAGSINGATRRACDRLAAYEAASAGAYSL